MATKKDKILVIAEPDYSPISTVERATWLARIYDCDMHLMLADAPITVPGDGIFQSPEAQQIHDWIISEQQAMADELAMEARDLGIKVRTEVLKKRPLAEAILARAEKLDPRFIVKATQYHSEADRAIFMHTDWRLIRAAQHPLWLVKPHSVSESPVILCAVDPTHAHDKSGKLDQAIVDAGLSLASHGNGSLMLLHTFEAMEAVGEAAKFALKPVRLPLRSLRAKVRKEHRALLDKLAADNGIPRKNTHQLPGRAHEIIPAFARGKKADVVVLGALARWSLKRRVIGSTAEKVLDHLPCDILLVPAQ